MSGRRSRDHSRPLARESRNHRAENLTVPEGMIRCKSMIPQHLRSMFWDTNVESFEPRAYPVYTILRVLEHGDEEDVAWLRQLFTKEEIHTVLRTDRRLSPRSANFWALIFGLPDRDVAALKL